MLLCARKGTQVVEAYRVAQNACTVKIGCGNPYHSYSLLSHGKSVLSTRVLSSVKCVTFESPSIESRHRLSF